jgi:glycosyltransferase involved in cell wall biosynthesis
VSELAILVPVLARPHRVRPLLESICGTVPEDSRVVFVCDRKDYDEQRAIASALYEGEYGPLQVQVLLHNGGYAQKINAAVRLTEEPLVLLAADDLEFVEGWFDVAVDTLGGGIEVVGINDLIDREREHATHFLMTRAYAERPTIDGKPGPLHEGYHSWFTDDELIATAKKRGVYAYADAAHIQHLHIMNGKAFDDDTYRKGRAHARDDRRHYRSRIGLWR